MIQNLKQFSGVTGSLAPSVLIPQEKINVALGNLLKDIPGIRSMKFKFRADGARVEAVVQYGMLFTVSLELKPLGIRVEDEFLKIRVLRMAPATFRSQNMFNSVLLKILEKIIIPVFRFDVFKKLGSRLPELSIHDHIIEFRIEMIKLIDAGVIPKSAKWMLNAVRPRGLSFVEGGVRIGFKVFPQFFR